MMITGYKISILLVVLNIKSYIHLRYFITRCFGIFETLISNQVKLDTVKTPGLRSKKDLSQWVLIIMTVTSVKQHIIDH